MNQGDTLIHIDVQADPLIAIEIRELVRETFAYMPPWKMVGNAIFAPSDCRFFAFNLSSQEFIWLRGNDSYDDTMDEDDVVIRDLADISHLLEFVWLNGERLRPKPDLYEEFNKFFGNPPLTAEEKKQKERKKKQEAKSKLNVAVMKKKLDAMYPKAQFNPMHFVDEEEDVGFMGQ